MSLSSFSFSSATLRVQGAGLLLLATLPFLPGLNVYYYIDDGLSLHLGQCVVEGSYQTAFSFGFNGHLRPLPILSWAAVEACCGAGSPIPFRLFALLLHSVNVWLCWRWLCRLLGPTMSGIAWMSSALFAMHWYATEAVTYISSLGVLWCMFGGLVSCFGVLELAEKRWCRGCGLLWLGMVTALAGGEYGLATVPLILATALLDHAETDWRKSIWPAFRIALLLAPLLVAYISAEILFANHQRLGTQYRFGRHVLLNLRDNVGRLAFPSGWIGMDLCFCLVAANAVFALYTSRGRAFWADARTWWTLLASLGALLPFAPSLMGNYGRFLYVAVPLFSVWLLRLLDVNRRTLLDWNPPGAFLAASGSWLAVFLLVAHGVHVEKGIHACYHYAEPLREIVQQWQHFQSAYPTAQLHVWAPQPEGSYATQTMQVLHLVQTQNIERTAPRSRPTANEIWLVLKYQSDEGFRESVWLRRSETLNSGA